MIESIGVMPEPAAMATYSGAAVRVGRHREAAGRRHHVELVADPQVAEHPLAERASGQLLDPDPQPARRRAR